MVCVKQGHKLCLDRREGYKKIVNHLNVNIQLKNIKLLRNI